MNTTNLDATVVIEACQKYLDAREARIEAEREPLIQKRMNGLFKKDREQAIKSLENSGDIFSEWNRIELKGSCSANDVQLLLSLAEVAEYHNSKVTIDSKTADILRKYFYS